jgi:hypothetical protein
MENSDKCLYCSAPFEAGDNYCRRCGKAREASVPFRYTHAGIIVLTLLFGPVALPFIWKSPAISQKGRAVYLLMNLLITAFMVSFLIGVYGNVSRQVRETMRIIEVTGVGARR